MPTPDRRLWLTTPSGTRSKVLGHAGYTLEAWEGRLAPVRATWR